MSTPRPKPTENAAPPWYRVPFVWFLIGLGLATLLACVHLIVLSVQADDPSVLDPQHQQVFKVPVATPPVESVPRTEPEP